MKWEKTNALTENTNEINEKKKLKKEEEDVKKSGKILQENYVFYQTGYAESRFTVTKW